MIQEQEIFQPVMKISLLMIKNVLQHKKHFQLTFNIKENYT